MTDHSTHMTHNMKFSMNGRYDGHCTRCGLTGNDDLSGPCEVDIQAELEEPTETILHSSHHMTTSANGLLQHCVKCRLTDRDDLSQACQETFSTNPAVSGLMDHSLPHKLRTEDISELLNTQEGRDRINSIVNNWWARTKEVHSNVFPEPAESDPHTENSEEKSPVRKIPNSGTYGATTPPPEFPNLFMETPPTIEDVVMQKHDTHEEHQYLNLLADILEDGTYKGDRTGVGCYSIYGAMMCFNLLGGKIPLLTTKRMGIKSIIAELLWFLEGSTDNTRLNELGATIWDEWALEDGELGPIYGKQWTAWEAPDVKAIHEELEQLKDTLLEQNPSLPENKDSVASVLSHIDRIQETLRNPPKINQIQELITSLKENPNSRRMLVTAWNPAVLPRDYRWEYQNFEEMESLPQACGWESMTLDQRMDWLWEHKGIGHGIFDADILEEHKAPTHRRKVKITPHENVEEGRASLPACHTMFQVHTREMTFEQRLIWASENCPEVMGDFLEYAKSDKAISAGSEETQKEANRRHSMEWLDQKGVPRHALTLQFYCRSQDVPLGTPYNIASYGILAHMLAQCTNMVAEELIWMGGDCHVYTHQVEKADIQLDREPRSPWPTLMINPEKKDIFSFEKTDFELVGYHPHDKIDFGAPAV